MSAVSAGSAEKRGFPRVHLLRPMKLIHENGTVVNASLRDLSPGGIQAMCARDAAHALVPDLRADPSVGSQVYAGFKLPVAGELLAVEVDCRLVHLSLVENEGVAIGLRFVSFRGESLENLRQFILYALEPSY